LWDFWALPHHIVDDGDWRTWVVMGGRGAGKTRAGAEWVRGMVEGPRPLDQGQARRVALVGETIEQARDVMVFGDSGILACSPLDRRPKWEATKKRLVWENGAEARLFSAHDPESLRGPQFDAAWCDELAKWKKARAAWDMLQFGLRLGERPRQIVTTTPRSVAVLRDILEAPSTVATHAPTEANRAYLAESFLQEVRARYAGTRLGRQELDGVLLDAVDGAFWAYDQFDACRIWDRPEVDRIVVAVDPPVSSHMASDECGIVVAGVAMQGPPAEWRAYVLEDATVQGASPIVWATAAVETHPFYRVRLRGHRQGDEPAEPVPRSQVLGIGPARLFQRRTR
jgi:phage terminase large subunit-like protein